MQAAGFLRTESGFPAFLPEADIQNSRCITKVPLHNFGPRDPGGGRGGDLGCLGQPTNSFTDSGMTPDQILRLPRRSSALVGLQRLSDSHLVRLG